MAHRLRRVEPIEHAFGLEQRPQAGVLLLELEDLGIDYIERRNDLINAVSLDAVKAEAKRLLSTEPAVMMVGRKQPDGG